MNGRDAAFHFSNVLRYRHADHPDQVHITPLYVLTPVRLDLGGGIGLDPCTSEDNPVGAERFYTAADDGLAQPWSGPGWSPSVFCNPPYGKAREPWVTRCADAGRRGQPVVLLIPAATDTRSFQAAAESADAVVFVRGRLKFGTLRPNRRQAAASHPSALIGWNTALTAAAGLGLRMAAAGKATPRSSQASLFGSGGAA